MAKVPKKNKSLSTPISTQRDRQQLWENVRGMIGDPPLASQSDFWDPERDTWFRPTKFFSEQDAAQSVAEALVSHYRTIQKEEAKVAAPSGIIRNFESARNNLIKAAGWIENLAQAELRVSIQAAPEELRQFAQDLTPLRWPGPDGRSNFTIQLRERAGKIDALLEVMRQRNPGTAWAKVGGQGHSILHHLGAASSSWQLVHMSWRVWEDFGRAMPATASPEDFLLFLSYVHELATGLPDLDFGQDVARYVTLRRDHDALERVLRVLSVKYGSENFFQLQDYVERRSSRRTSSKSVAELKLITDQYVALRTQLTCGPTPDDRERKPPKKNQGSRARHKSRSAKGRR